jgi:hypothetical protein
MQVIHVDHNKPKRQPLAEKPHSGPFADWDVGADYECIKLLG